MSLIFAIYCCKERWRTSETRQTDTLRCLFLFDFCTVNKIKRQLLCFAVPVLIGVLSQTVTRSSIETRRLQDIPQQHAEYHNAQPV
jgi:hypothetical protein